MGVVMRTSTDTKLDIAMVAAGGLITVILVVGAIFAPLIPVAIAVLVFSVWASITFGLLPTLLQLGLIALAVSSLAGRYVPAAGVLNSVGTALIIAVGVAMIPKARLPRAVGISGAVFVTICTFFALITFSGAAEYSFRGWIAVVAAPFSVVATAGVLNSSKTRHKKVQSAIVGTLLGAVLLNVLLGLKQSILGLDAAELRSAKEGESTYLVGDQIRIMGAFQSNQDMGLFLACAAPAFLVLALASSGRRRNWFWVLTAATYIVNFLSLTRTSLIAGAAAGIIALLVWGKGDVIARVAKNIFIAALGLGLVAFVLSLLDIPRLQAAAERALTLFSLASDTSYNARIGATLPIAWARFTENPLGLGVGSAGPISAQFPNVAPLGYLTADNGYLNIAIQVGVVGFAVFACLLLATLFALGRRGNSLSNAAAGAVLALIIAMTTAGYWSLLGPICLIGSFVGLGFAAQRQAEELTDIDVPKVSSRGR
jgi:putative inorganic carbon (HCO3(-)) transporter